jgi:hypothetical protein
MKAHRIVALLFAVLFFIYGCNEKKPISEAEAQQLAANKLVDYAKRHNLSVDQFSGPEVRYNKELELWEIHYQSNTTPKHNVALMVGKSGGVEESFLIEGDKQN